MALAGTPAHIGGSLLNYAREKLSGRCCSVKRQSFELVANPMVRRDRPAVLAKLTDQHREVSMAKHLVGKHTAFQVLEADNDSLMHRQHSLEPP